MPTRRQFIQASALAAATPVLHAADAASKPRFGIGMHSYGAQWSAARADAKGAKFHDALSFLGYAGDMGAAGVQVAIGSREDAYAKALREVAESRGLYLEGQLHLPKNEADTERFEAELRTAKAAGASVLRTALLFSGRRYETFDTAEQFREFAARAWTALERAEPLLRRHGLHLAIENHKDWLVPDLLDVLRRISSEHVGVCVDTGNSIALLEDPMAVVEAYAPFAASVHLKDMAVAESPDGFLLSEIPFGNGFLDLGAMVRVLAKAKPNLCFNIEMITREPLRIPCLTGKYWATLADTPAMVLARALAQVRKYAVPESLPRVTGKSPVEVLKFEDENVRACLAHARERLAA